MSKIDLVSSTDEAYDILLGLLAQLTSLLSQDVQLLTGSTRIHLLELLVQVLHLFLGHSRELADIRHFSVHVCISLDGRASCHDESGDGSNHYHECGLPVVHLAVEAVPKAFSLDEVSIDTGYLRLDASDSPCIVCSRDEDPSTSGCTPVPYVHTVWH